MAAVKLPNSRVVIRFQYGGAPVKGRQRFENTSRFVARDIAISYSEGFYKEDRKQLEDLIERDVRAELSHVVSLYKRHVIGAGGTKTGPAGTLDTVAKGASRPSVSIAGQLDAWAPRSERYLSAKRYATGGVKWFSNRGWTNKIDRRGGRRQNTWTPGHGEHGHMESTVTAGNWETMFGVIKVKFQRNRKGGAAAGAIRTEKDHQMTQLGTITVTAFSHLTKSMLPGYEAANVRGSASGNPALIDLVRRHDPNLALRMGRLRNGIYRPTIEPFLGFFLTRAIPHAVGERIRKGAGGLIIRQSKPS